jgi:hypothetical protein
MKQDELLTLADRLEFMSRKLLEHASVIHKYAVPRSGQTDSISKWVFSFVEDVGLFVFYLRQAVKEKDKIEYGILQINAKKLYKDADRVVEYGRTYLLSLLN